MRARAGLQSGNAGPKAWGPVAVRCPHLLGRGRRRPPYAGLPAGLRAAPRVKPDALVGRRAL